MLYFIWFIKRGVSLLGLEGTGLKDTADFAKTETKSAVSFKPVPSSPKSETPRFINHIKWSKSRNAKFDFGKSITSLKKLMSQKV